MRRRSELVAIAAGAAAVVLLWPTPASATSGAPARGTSTGELLGATAVTLVAFVAAIIFGIAHRRRGTSAPLARLVEAKTGRPAWAVIPSFGAGASLLVAVFGYYWDVSWHIDRGRDPGAFAN